MLKTAPDPVDVQDLQFKLHCRVKVFENADNAVFNQHCSLVACASRFGLVFVGTNTSHVQVIQVKDIEKYTKSDGDKTDYPRRNLPLVSRPLHVSVNCEHTILAVVVETNNCPCALFYDVKSFWQQEIIKLAEIRLSATPKATVKEVNWNPAIASIFTACKSDGSLGVYEIKNGGVDINELPAAAGATCFCWSPKGKQIAVGSRDGKITQLKPDLKAVKIINAPPLKEPHSLASLQWVSNYQFIGVFQRNNPEGPALFIVVDAPKTGDPTYINYDDICYSNGCTRLSQFYTVLLHSWNVLMAASANSMEVGILGNSGETWTQWIMGDAARAELPLSSNHQETLPIGCGLEIGATAPVPWGESTLPPAPFLLLLSHHGMLCCFSIINLKAGLPSICTPPDPITDTSGLQHFRVGVIQVPKAPSKVETQVQMTAAVLDTANTKPVVTSLPANTTVFKIQPQPSPQALNLPKTQSVNLFGGQATLTPIPQANKVAQPSGVQQHQSLFPSFSSSTSKPTTTTVQQPIVTTPGVPKVVVTVAQSVAPISTPKFNTPEPKEDTSKSEIASIDLQAEQEAEKIFAQMIREECVFLESELKAVLHHGKALKLNLGSDEDKTKIVESTKLLEDFFHEVLDICVTQNSEVHVLKQNLLQSWAWYEEVKFRHLASQDESMLTLMRAQPIDSASEKQLADIQHTNYYLESQISQAHLALDEQWENFQDYCKKTHKVQIPTMEMIFQTMVKQNAILQKQSYVLKDIAARLKNKTRSAVGPSLLLSLDNIEDLPDELKRLRMNSDDICQIQYERVANRMKNFTRTKANNLRSFLKKRDYTHVSAVKPQVPASVIQASPTSKLKQHSLFMTKTPQPKKLDFEHSTPKPAITKSEPVVADKPNTAIQSLENFALKFESKHFSGVSETKSFAPLTKNVIASSPNSAFVSTVSPATMKPGFLGISTASTVASASKTTSFVTVSTSQVSTGTKPFSFITPSPSVSAQESKPAGVFSSSVSNTTALSSAGAATTKAPVFVTANATSGFGVTTKPSPLTTFNLTSSTTSATNLAKPATPNLAFGSSTSAPFSFSSTPASIFGTASQKVESFDSAASKAFVFSKGTSPSTTTPQSLLTSKLINNSPATSIFATTETSATIKVTTTPQLSLFSSAPVTAAKNAAVPTVASSSIFGPSATTVTSATTQTSIFGSTTATFSANATKSLFASVAPITSSPAVTTSSTVSTVGSTASSSSVSTSTASIFGTLSTPKASTFGTLASTSGNSPTSSTLTSVSQLTTPKSNVFGVTATTSASASSGTSTTGFSFISSSANKASIFAASDATASKPSIFGSVATTTSTTLGSTPPSTTQSSIFGAVPSTTASSFAVSTAPSTQPSLFGTPSSTSSVFGTSTATTTQPSIFGTAVAASGFGSPSTTTQSVFGTVVSTTTSLFGAPTPSTAQSIFGSSASNQTPIFGGTTTTTTPQSIFGNPPVTTTQSQAFGSSVFGGPAAAGSTQASIFGGSNQSTGFGSATSTTSTVFGQNQTTSTFGQSVFGTSGSTFGASGAFGTSAPTFGQSSSIFGNPPATTSASIFGGSTTVFGTPSSTAPPFGSTDMFSANTTQPSSFSATTSGTFGFGGLNVGATATTSSSGFGSATSNPFGGENKSVFGSSSSSNPVFGSSTGSLFGPPPQSFSGNGFGNPPAFGQQPGFGQSSFGASTFGQTPAGPFSGGSGSVSQSGFGTGSTFQKPGFGSSPVFGGSPSFGSAPSFGGSPSFGSAPAFGGSPKVFGAASSGFGAGAGGSTQTAGFGNMANQATVGFGNLAQQAANAATPNAAFSGSSSFSSWR